VNKKVRQLARRSVLSQKVSENNFIVIDNILPETPKTKKVTVLTDTMEENLYLGSRNIKNICVVPVQSASTYDLLDCQMILANEASVEILNKQLS